MPCIRCKSFNKKFANKLGYCSKYNWEIDLELAMTDRVCDDK